MYKEEKEEKFVTDFFCCVWCCGDEILREKEKTLLSLSSDKMGNFAQFVPTGTHVAAAPHRTTAQWSRWVE